MENAYASRDLGMWHNISRFFKSYCKGIFLLHSVHSVALPNKISKREELTGPL